MRYVQDNQDQTQPAGIQTRQVLLDQPSVAGSRKALLRVLDSQAKDDFTVFNKAKCQPLATLQAGGREPGKLSS